ncbi:hypothetical protein HK104_001602 [Borealophlyctis nickersoniae]|nr:hypothetical protein HK104_001602 [Borealophlyctis nickersoniae]
MPRQPPKSERFFTEDTVALLTPFTTSESPYSPATTTENCNIGLVMKTHWDEESDLEDDEEDEEVAKAEKVTMTLQKMPEGSVFLSLLDGSPAMFCKEDDIELIDRAMCFGDIVRYKSHGQTSQSGTVAGVRMLVTLRHVMTGRVLPDIDTRKLRYVHDVEEDMFVARGDWVGTVEELWDNATILFQDGSVCVPLNQNTLEPTVLCDESSHFGTDRFFPGQTVRTRRLRGFEHGSWLVGGYNKQTAGVVLHLATEKIRVNWSLYNSLKNTGGDASIDEPPEIVDFSSVKVLPSNFEYASYQIGDKVMFKNIEDLGESLTPPPKVGIPVATCQMCLTVIRTKTIVDVEWQDGTMTKDILSTDLVPCLHLDDQDLWPTDYVIQKKEQDESAPESSEPEKVGLVVKVDYKERTAKVRWFDENMEGLLEPVEEYSLYEIVSHPNMQFRIGQKVVLAVDANAPATPTDTLSWLGEVMAISNNGLVRVRFYHTDKEAEYSPRRLVLVEPEEDGAFEDDDEDEWTDEEYLDEWEDDDGSDDVEEEDDALGKVDVKERNGRRKRSRSPQKAEKAVQTAGAGEEELVEMEGRLESIVNGAGGDVPRSVTEGVDQEETTEIEDEPNGTNGNGSGDTLDGRWDTFKSFERAPESHHFFDGGQEEYSRSFHQRIRKEYMILNKSLPDGILVRVFEDRIDLLRVLMVGPEGTPYDNGLFLFDVSLPNDYPQSPPCKLAVYFHSWTNGMGRLNPNLYEDGKVCLSLLGTWQGKGCETWSPLSNILQVLVSIQGLVLVRHPYYNEAGYDRQLGTSEGSTNAILYNERTYLLTLKSIYHIIQRPPATVQDEVREYYFRRGALKRVVERGEEIVRRSEERRSGAGIVEDAAMEEGEVGEFPIRVVSAGCLKLLKTSLEHLKQLIPNEGQTEAGSDSS